MSKTLILSFLPFLKKIYRENNLLVDISNSFSILFTFSIKSVQSYFTLFEIILIDMIIKLLNI